MIYWIKRGVALFTDVLLFSPFMVFIPDLLLTLYPSISGVVNVLRFLPFLFKDAIFNGTSIGKRITGLVVCKISWKKPSFVESLKRTGLSWLIGYLLFAKSLFLGRMIDFFDWERDVLKSFVLEKKLLKKLQSKASFDKEKMLLLYNEYIRSQYVKR